MRAAPSLALVKYWGKSDAGRNLPATSSLAVTVTGLYTEVRLQASSGSDHLRVDGTVVPAARHGAFFDAARATLDVAGGYRAEASNNFPGGAGLASSASLFAALALGCAALAGRDHLSGTPLGSGPGRLGIGRALPVGRLQHARSRVRVRRRRIPGRSLAGAAVAGGGHVAPPQAVAFA